MKQFAKSEMDLKFAQDKLQKVFLFKLIDKQAILFQIEYFITMSLSSLQQDHPGVVSASVFAESAYNLINSKREILNSSMEVANKNPHIHYLSDLVPILNGIRSLGQLDVDGIIKVILIINNINPLFYTL